MDLEKVLDLVPELIQLTPEVMRDISYNDYGIRLDFNKTWEYNGYDQLDLVELLMKIEKMLDISVQDDIAEALFNEGTKPPNFISYIRDRKLDQLGISRFN